MTKHETLNFINRHTRLFLIKSRPQIFGSKMRHRNCAIDMLLRKKLLRVQNNNADNNTTSGTSNFIFMIHTLKMN